MKKTLFNLALTGLLACGVLVSCGDSTTSSDVTPVDVTEATVSEEIKEEHSQHVEKASSQHIANVTAQVDDDRLANAGEDHSNWLTYGLSYQEQRYSELTQINKENLEQLGLAWTIQLDSTRGIQSTPIVVDGIMYLTGPWSVVHAIDVRKGAILWTHDPQVDREVASSLCCGPVNRGVALYKGLVIFGTLDGRLVALDAASGNQSWSVMTIPEEGHYSITGAPRIAKGKVIIGNGGAEFSGTRGYVTAYDALTGEYAWRFYTVPGDPAEEQGHPALDAALPTWTGEWWKQGGGGTVWDSIVYDPELEQLYIGVGNGAHWNREIRSPDGGDNLYLSSIVSLDPDDGSYNWHYQTTPGDTWDYTATQHIMLADLEVEGEMRKVLMQAPKNGFFYVIDRVNGEFISAEPYAYVSWATGIDESGRPIEAEGSRYLDGKTHWISPSSHGGHNWMPMAYNPKAGLVYIPGVKQAGPYSNLAVSDYDANDNVMSSWDGVASMAVRFYLDAVYDSNPAAPQPGTAGGELIAYDPVKQERAWSIPMPSLYNGGVLATASDLILQGNAQGEFVIRDAYTGESLWQFDVRSGVLAPPVTYMVDGEQYITLSVEWGGGRGQSVKFVDKLYPGTIYTFKLGGKAPAPERLPAVEAPLTKNTTEYTPLQIGQGFNLYIKNCVACHEGMGRGGGAVPDLTRANDGIYAIFSNIVRDGLFASRGMPKHSHLSEEDVDLIKNFLFYTAQTLRSGASYSQYMENIAGMQKLADEESRSQ